jgi:hypothetical protein
MPGFYAIILAPLPNALTDHESTYAIKPVRTTSMLRRRLDGGAAEMVDVVVLFATLLI